MLRITVHDQPDQISLRLEGDLSGSWVSELEDSWRAARVSLAGRGMSIDLTGVEHVDGAGRYLLALLGLNGAVLLASGTEMTELVRTVTGNWPDQGRPL
jgi:ABC-type transporter Mla MlaB component